MTVPEMIAWLRKWADYEMSQVLTKRQLMEADCKVLYVAAEMLDVPRSPRGLPLVLTSDWKKIQPIVTVELYEKWYELFLVDEGKVTPISFMDLEYYCRANESAFVDHVPNPRAVVEYCRDKDLRLDNVAFEMMIGRWEIEIEENYP